jgi:hypothetical protein
MANKNFLEVIKRLIMKWIKKEWNKDNMMADVGLPRGIDDIPELKETLIDIFLTKGHKDISYYSVLLAGHTSNLVNIQPDIKVLRIMAQVANTPHAHRRALIASDYAVALINLIYPKNLEEVRKEREIQIELMKSI